MFRTNATHRTRPESIRQCVTTTVAAPSSSVSRLTVSVSHSQLLSTGVPIVYRTYVACIMCVCWAATAARVDRCYGPPGVAEEHKHVRRRRSTGNHVNAPIAPAVGDEYWSRPTALPAYQNIPAMRVSRST